MVNFERNGEEGMLRRKVRLKLLWALTLASIAGWQKGNLLVDTGYAKDNLKPLPPIKKLYTTQESGFRYLQS